MNTTNMDEYFSGTRLYGDDFGPEEIAAWYADEKEGYASLGDKSRASYVYQYHSLNRLHGFRFIRGKKFRSALGLGSAYGDEFLPIAGQIDHITIVDPSDAFRAETVGGVPCDYLKPSIDGFMPFADGSFDLATCLGVLHHIPNVTTVVRELHRCLAPGGYLLLREPIVSMGDWTKPRRTATKRERGIPLNVFRDIIIRAGFCIVSQRLCVVPGVSRISRRVGVHAYNNLYATGIDAVFSWVLRWNVRYYATRPFHRIRPTSVYYVLSK